MADLDHAAHPRTLALSRAAAAAVLIATVLLASPLAAAEQGGADQSGDRAAGKSQPSSDKPDRKPADKSDSKTGDKSDDKAGDKSDNKAEGQSAEEGEKKPDDPCDREKLLVDFEYRYRLCQSGIKFALIETSEVLANLTGGLRQGAIYEGVTDASLNLDFRPTYHWRGNLFARAYQIHGRGLTFSNTDNLNEISSIEASATTRLVELWYEHHFDNWRLRIGQQTIQTEFLNPEPARLFVNGALGWPTLPAIDLPTGGPGYPLGTPAVRLRVDPGEGLTLFLALFNGDPTGAGVGGPQLRDASGTAFRTGDGAFVINEIRYNRDSSDKNGTYRFGGWWHSERFRDLHVDTNGVSLASPDSNGRPLRHDNNFSLYGIADQPFLIDEATRLTVFARAMGAPGDRNLVGFYADAGLVYKGAFGRADDQLGLALGYARVGGAARAFDADLASFTGLYHPVRSAETVLELTYRFQLTGWWQLQPDFQYIFNPGGGLANPLAPGRRLGDEAVVGLRTAITF